MLVASGGRRSEGTKPSCPTARAVTQSKKGLSHAERPVGNVLWRGLFLRGGEWALLPDLL